MYLWGCAGVRARRRRRCRLVTGTPRTRGFCAGMRARRRRRCRLVKRSRSSSTDGRLATPNPCSSTDGRLATRNPCSSTDRRLATRNPCSSTDGMLATIQEFHQVPRNPLLWTRIASSIPGLRAVHDFYLAPCMISFQTQKSLTAGWIFGGPAKKE